MIKLEDLKLKDGNEHHKSFFSDLSSFLDKLEKSPEILQAINDGNVAEYIFYDVIRGDILINYSDLNIPEIILDCISTEAYLSDSEKSFSITDIKDENILTLLTGIDYNIKPLLKFWNKLDERSQAKNFYEWQEDESREENERLDAEWIEKNGSECDNCDSSQSRGHICGEDFSDSYDIEEETKVPITVDSLISEIIKDFEISQTAQCQELKSLVERQRIELDEYRKFHTDITPLLDKLDKSPEIVQAIIDGNITGDLAKAAMKGKVSISD